jgi:hypothetical protein
MRRTQRLILSRLDDTKRWCSLSINLLSFTGPATGCNHKSMNWKVARWYVESVSASGAPLELRLHRESLSAERNKLKLFKDH